MDTKQYKSNLTIKDFKEEDMVYVHKCGDMLITFYETYGSCAKMNVQVWYSEGKKRYLKDEKVIGWRPTKNLYEVKERNNRMWAWINKFNKMYCHGK